MFTALMMLIHADGFRWEMKVQKKIEPQETQLPKEIEKSEQFSWNNNNDYDDGIWY